MWQGDEDGECPPIRIDHASADVKNPAHDVTEAPAGQKSLMGQTAQEDDHVRMNERELAVEVRTAQIHLGRARPAIASSGAFPRKAFGYRCQVNMTANIRF